MDLSLVSIKELIGEINNRTDACVMVLLQTRNKDIEQENWSFHGGKYTCLGLLRYMQDRLMIECNKRYQET